jgi:hypothetical protein
VQPSLSRPGAGAATVPPKAVPQVPNQLRRDHSNVPGAQYDVGFNNLFQSDQPGAAPQAQNYPPQPSGPQPEAPRQAYDFILSPEQPRRHFNLPGGGNKATRVALVAGALLVVLILFSIIRGLFSGGMDPAPYLSVAQDQQELIHLAQAATSQRDLSIVNKNYVYTARLSLASAQSGLLTYLNGQGHKVSPKTLNLKISAASDSRLASAQTAGTYNQTYHDVVESKLKTYLSDLNRAYDTSTGKKGRALLKDDYAQAQLLLKQLNAPAT